MKKVVILAATNSKQSINKQLALYAGSELKDVSLKVLDLNNYDLPIYGIDLETEKGIHPEAIKFSNDLNDADAYIISFAEHNGSYSAAFKNAYDWVSRVNYKVWGDKPTLLMATSPGARGGATVLQTATASFPYMGAKVVSSFSLPSFGDNFADNKIVNSSLLSTFKEALSKLQQEL